MDNSRSADLKFELQLRHDREENGGVDGMQLQNEVIDMACYFTFCTLTNHKRGIEELQRKVNSECGGIKRKEISTDFIFTI